MSDLESLKELLCRFGFKENTNPEAVRWNMKPDEYYIVNEDRIEVHLGSGRSDNFKFGYIGFAHGFVFDLNGKYIGHGAYE